MSKSDPKSLKVEERFKYPRGISVAEIRERYFNAVDYTESQLNRNVFPHECVDGWYVIDAVKTRTQVIVTFGRTDSTA